MKRQIREEQSSSTEQRLSHTRDSFSCHLEKMKLEIKTLLPEQTMVFKSELEAAGENAMRCRYEQASLSLGGHL